MAKRAADTEIAPSPKKTYKDDTAEIKTYYDGDYFRERVEEGTFDGGDALVQGKKTYDLQVRQ